MTKLFKFLSSTRFVERMGVTETNRSIHLLHRLCKRARHPPWSLGHGRRAAEPGYRTLVQLCRRQPQDARNL